MSRAEGRDESLLIRLSRAAHAVSDPFGYPISHIVFEPTNSSDAEFDLAGETSLNLKLVYE